MPVQLKIRRLESDETLIAEFERIEDAETWLRERPKHVAVLGTIGLDPELGDRLRDAMRPLDAEEEARIEELDLRVNAAIERAMEREKELAQAEIQARREQLADADPERPQALTWEHGHGCRNSDAADLRPIPSDALAAIEAWVAERDTWVHPRGQYIASAELVVWPGPIPSGDEADRVHPGGQFTALSGDPSD